MASIKINQMIAAANGVNHVVEYPEGKYCPMSNKVGTIHAVCDLQEILELRAQVEQLQNTSSNLTTELTQWQLQNNELLSKLYLMVNNGFTKEMEDAAKETDLGRFVDDEYPMFSGVVFMGLFYKMQRTIREMPSILSYLAERDAEVAAKAVNYVFDYIMTDFDVDPVAREITLTPKDLNEYRAQILSGHVSRLRQAAKAGE